MSSSPLFRVLDLSRLLPGAFATQQLAQLGAQVIKIERPPNGDYARAMPPYVTLDDERAEGAVFVQTNRNKQSVAIDYFTPRGRELLRRLCETADVYVESFRPGALRARGLDYDAVRARNPRIVYCALSGYGQNGPHRERGGHDLNYLALAGVLRLNGAPNAPPHPLPVQVGDLAGAMRAATEILGALLERERTGEGKFLDVALFDAAFEWMQSVVGASYRATEEEAERGALALGGLYPCYNVYTTSDGETMALGALEPKFWRAFCEGAGHAELIDRQFDPDAKAELRELFKTRSRAAWTEFSQRVDCCLEPLLAVSEAYTHPQVAARGLSSDVGRVPRLGEDTERILGELGIRPQEIQELRNENVVL